MTLGEGDGALKSLEKICGSLPESCGVSRLIEGIVDDIKEGFISQSDWDRVLARRKALHQCLTSVNVICEEDVVVPVPDLST